MDTKNKKMTIKGGELRDNPGWYKLDGRVEGESESWSAIRKPDGSWWWVAATHFFPPGGGDVRFDLGEEIRKEETMTLLEQNFIELLQRLRELFKEGDRVRVRQTGRPGTVKSFGSIPGVPRIVNVAYDGGGGCNHRPDELELIRENELDFTPHS